MTPHFLLLQTLGTAGLLFVSMDLPLLLSLASFTWHDIVKSHPCWWDLLKFHFSFWLNTVLLHDSATFYFPVPSVDGCLDCLHFWGIVNIYVQVFVYTLRLPIYIYIFLIFIMRNFEHKWKWRKSWSYHFASGTIISLCLTLSHLYPLLLLTISELSCDRFLIAYYLFINISGIIYTLETVSLK